MSGSTLDRVHRRRLATQRLSAGGLRRGADVVRLLTCVQAQDAPLAAWSLAMRMPAGTTYAGVLAEQSAGGWLRTHILRPTWHLVAPEDLRWIQRVTATKVESSMGARHRGLGLDDTTTTRALKVLETVLAGPTPRVRREVAAAFGEAGLPSGGEHVAHLLLLAELRAVVCSGPVRGTEHTYVLVDETVPRHPRDRLDAEDARRELVQRFMSGHGPASDRDLARWSTLTLTEIRAALADLAGGLECVEVGGETLWFDPAAPARTTDEQPAYLLPTFDEVSLTYATTSFLRRNATSSRPRLVSESGGGIVVVAGEDAGTWKRTVGRSGVRVVVMPDAALSGADVAAVQGAAERLGGFLERSVELEVVTTGARR